MAIRFLHTSDWQMGMKALQAGEKAKELRSKRYDSVAQVAAVARQESVDFVIIAGDLFEHHDVDESVVRKTVAALDAFAPITVFILPGNHDPLIAGGVWDRKSWQQAGKHVRLLRERAEVPLENDVTLYPSPLSQKQSNLDPTAWIPKREPSDDRIRIGVAHGSLDILPGQVNFPIAEDRVREAGLDYLALGDWHGFVERGNAVYSGTMEQTSFDESDSGNVAIVEISGAGAKPVVTKKRVGLLKWSEHRPEIHDETDVENLRQSLTSNGSLDKQMVRVAPNIHPDVSEDAMIRLAELREELLDEVFYLDWDEETIVLPMNVPVSIPEGMLTRIDSDLDAVLQQKIPEGPCRAAASCDPEIVREARSLLRKLSSEVKR